MSYVVYVKHFLKSGAAREFDDVFQLHRALASRRDGFVSLRRLTPTSAGHEDEVVVLGEFLTSEQSGAWRASPEHATVAERYRRLWARDPVTEFYNSTPE